MNIKLTEDFTGLDCAAVQGCINLDNPVVWFKSSLLCWRVLINSPDELALLRLLAVQIEAKGILYFLNVAKTRAQIVSFLLKTEISQINHRVQAKMEIYCIVIQIQTYFHLEKCYRFGFLHFRHYLQPVRGRTNASTVLTMTQVLFHFSCLHTAAG